MPIFDGSTDSDRNLWHTYVYLARKHAIRSGGQPAGRKRAFVDYRMNRVSESLAEALQAVLFSCFALEYRLRRALAAMDPSLQPEQNLACLVDTFWALLRNTDRCDGKGKCAAPKEWPKCKAELKKLIRLRNKIAHANYEKVLGFVGREDSLVLARSYYNAVVDAIMLINIGTGYDPRPLDDIEEYFRPLKMADEK